jgi:hypothetical protein
MSKWPPPPDLASIQQLVREADIEGHLADGAPQDEYEPEEEEIFAALASWETDELLTPRIEPVIAAVWQRSFSLSSDALAGRTPKIVALAAEIERFFGPAATPQVRGA